MDDALAGTRVLIAGGERDAARALGARLVTGAAQVTVARDAEAAAQAALAGQPDVIVALGAAEAELRELLDPLDLRTGPPLVPAADLDRPEEDENRATVRRLRALLDRAALERRARDLESALAAHTVGRRRDVEALRRDPAAARARRRVPRRQHPRAHGARRRARRAPRPAARTARARGHPHPPPGAAARRRQDRDPRLDPARARAALGAGVRRRQDARRGGARVLADSESEVLEVAESIARSHHERWDGSGYPGSLAGADIPLVGRLVHVADVFDILVHERPNKEALTVEAAAEEITGAAGTQFDPEVVEAFSDLGRRGWLAAPGVYGG